MRGEGEIKGTSRRGQGALEMPLVRPKASAEGRRKRPRLLPLGLILLLPLQLRQSLLQVRSWKRRRRRRRSSRDQDRDPEEILLRRFQIALATNYWSRTSKLTRPAWIDLT